MNKPLPEGILTTQHSHQTAPTQFVEANGILRSTAPFFFRSSIVSSRWQARPQPSAWRSGLGQGHTGHTVH